MSVRQAFLDNVKNVLGWRTRRKLVAFAVDDYCNVRLASRAARDNLISAGLDLSSHFDQHDAMETQQDLEALFETLDSLRDSRGQPGVFTAYVLSANPDFERIRADGDNYYFEPVTETFRRLAAEQPDAYQGAWALWQEGMDRKLIRPQFHGREHLNVELFERKLRARAADVVANLENECLAGLSGEPSMPGVGYTQAFGLHDGSELNRHREILRDGIDLFEEVWGFRSTAFTPPAQQLHPSLFEVAEAGGVQAIDKPLRCARPMGDGTYKREINRSGRQRSQNHLTVVRNVVFEPGKDMGFDPVSHAMDQVAAAFRWRRPAIISSHRVNFSGHVDESNRDRSLAALRRLLHEITTRWPDVEFVTVDRIAEMMQSESA